MQSFCVFLSILSVSAILSLPIVAVAQQPQTPGVTDALGKSLPLFDELLKGQESENKENGKKVDQEVEKLWKGSIMFDAEKVRWVNEAIKAKETEIPLEILMPNLFPSTAVQKQAIPEEIEEADPVSIVEEVQELIEDVFEEVALPTEAPVYYLRSVMFLSSESWTVWLNDKKLSFGQTYDNVEIISVENDRVILLWKNSQINQISPGWQNSMYRLDGTKLYSNNKDILVDDATGNVTFILQTNQTFVSKDLEIIEGFKDATNLAGVGQNDDAIIEDEEEIIGSEEQAEAGSIDNRAEQVSEGMKVIYQHQQNLDMLRQVLERNQGRL